MEVQRNTDGDTPSICVAAHADLRFFGLHVIWLLRNMINLRFIRLLMETLHQTGEHRFQLPKSALWFGDKSALLAQGAVFSGTSVIDCSLFGSTAALIRPLRLGHCIYMYCWKVAIAVYVNVTILGYRLKKDVTSSKNKGRSVLYWLGRAISA